MKSVPRTERSVRIAKNSWKCAVEALEGRQLLTIDLTTYPLPMVLRSTPTSVAQGPDGNLWVTESQASKVAKVGTDGKLIQEFNLPIPLGTSIGSIVSGPGNELYFSQLRQDANFNPVAKIARITTSGELTEFDVEAGATVASLAKGADGNIWFTANVYTAGINNPRIGRLTPDGQIATFAVPGASGYFGTIVAAADGNLWFTDSAAGPDTSTSKIGKITTSGVATEFALPTPYEQLTALTAGPDGNVWFSSTTYTNSVTSSLGKITPDGKITEYPLPANANTYSQEIGSLSPGSDGNVWFTQPGRVGKITPSGQISSAAIPSQPFFNNISASTLGSDGNTWYLTSDLTTTRLGKVTPALEINEFALPQSYTTDPTYGIPVSPNHIARGSDGMLWFATYSDQTVEIRRMALDGTYTVFPVSTRGDGSWLNGITRGPDGNIWFTTANANGGVIGKISPTGTVTKYNTPGTISPVGIAAGSDGNLWVAGMSGTRSSLLKVTTSGAIKSRELPAGMSVSGPMLNGPGGKLWMAATRQSKGRRGGVMGEVAIVDLNSGKLVEVVLPKSKKNNGPIPLAANVRTDSSKSAASPSAAASSERLTVARGSAPRTSPTSPIPGKLAANVNETSLPIYYQNYFTAQAMTLGPDGNAWIAAIANGSSRIIRMTPRGKMTSYEVPENLQASSITMGSDGNLWFSANQQMIYPMLSARLYPSPQWDQPGKVGRITPGGAMTLFALPEGLNRVDSITTGSDGKLWLTDANSSRVAKLTPPALFSGTLEAESLTGEAPNATNDGRPNFEGVAHPDAYVTLFAKDALDSRIALGTVRADKSGQWSLEPRQSLPDGSYKIFGGESTSAGTFYSTPEPLSGISVDGSLLVDTSAPRIAATSFDAKKRQVSITLSDSGAGFQVPANLSSYASVLSDTSNYELTRKGWKTPLNFSVTLAPGSTSSQATVLLTLDETGTGLGAVKVRVRSERFLDQAGNRLDGEFRGKLPSGNGRAGGDFVATLKSIKSTRA